MHAGNDIRMLKCLDGLSISFSLLDFNYIDLHETCNNIKNDKINIVPAISKCWGIIDQVHRIREISQAIPGLSKENKNRKIFLERTEAVEQCRHYIQHLREELLIRPPHPYPVWGSLSWVDDYECNKMHTAIIGTQIQGTQYASCIWDNLEKRWVSKVSLAVKDNSINFDTVYDDTLEFKKFILDWIINTCNFEIKTTTNIPILSFYLEQVDIQKVF